MRKSISIYLILLITLLSLVGCSSNNTNTITTETTSSVSPKYSYDSAKSILLNDTSAEVANGITYEDNNVIISSNGAYSISGISKNIGIIINCEGEVDLYLNGIDMYTDSKPCIYSKKSSKTFIIAMDNTTNTLKDSSNKYIEDEDSKLDAVIFSRSDLYFDGSGKLNITGNFKHSICGKDSIYLNNIIINSSSVKKGICTNDEIIFYGGTYDITSYKGDCIQSNNVDSGDVIINGGNFNLTAANEAIHAENALIINGGTIDIKKSKESLEGHTIDINGGDISLISEDDGINAKSGNNEEGFKLDKRDNDSFNPMNNNPPQDDKELHKEDSNKQNPKDESCYIHINGGNLDINSNGDALDSKGELVINGGTIIGFSVNDCIDVDTNSILNGGNILLYSSKEINSFNKGDSNSIILNLSKSINSGDNIEIYNSSNEKILNTTAKNSSNYIIIGGDKFINGDYILKINDIEYNFNINKGHNINNI